jgi:predicted transcriptional regulator
MTDDTRTRIRACVEAHPGLHFNGLVRQLDVATGQLQYHLQHLVNHDVLVRETHYGQTHYYPPDIDPSHRGILALVRRETSREILFDLLEHGSTQPADVADRLGIARSTLQWHLDRLVEQGVVRKRTESGHPMTLVVDRRDETLQLLETIEPSLPERMVDRFEQLFDSLFSEQGETS